MKIGSKKVSKKTVNSLLLLVKVYTEMTTTINSTGEISTSKAMTREGKDSSAFGKMKKNIRNFSNNQELIFFLKLKIQ